MIKRIKIKINAVIDDEKAGNAVKEIKTVATEIKEELEDMTKEQKEKEGVFEFDIDLEEEAL